MSAQSVENLRAEAEKVGAAGGAPEAVAEAWLRLAEAAPIFRYHGAGVRAALERASASLPVAGRSDLDARAALRAAELELAEENHARARELADVATVAAQAARLPALELLARIVAARGRLRGDEPSEAAAELELIGAAVNAMDEETVGSDELVQARLAAMLMIGLAELNMARMDLPAAAESYHAAEQVITSVQGRELVDAQFAVFQGIALSAALKRSFGRACDRLRSVLKLVNEHVARRDEVETRIALGNMLTQLGKNDEASKHLDVARALAREVAGVNEALLATSSSALAAMHAGKFGRALDRAYEAVKMAGLEKRDLMAFVSAVSLIANIHLAQKNNAEAYLALLNGAVALKHRLGPQAAALLEVQIEELRTAMGEDEFEDMCAAILRAREAREDLGKKR